MFKLDLLLFLHDVFLVLAKAKPAVKNHPVPAFLTGIKTKNANKFCPCKLSG